MLSLPSFFAFLLFGVFFVADAALAQCCWCDADDGCQLGWYLADWYDPYTGNPWCGPCSGNNCSYCEETLCQDYTLTCPSDDGSPAWATIKCKLMANNCDGVSGCTKYEACNSATGSVWADVSSNCHLESGTCYGNTRNCNLFANHTENGSMNCTASYQQNQAVWNPTYSAWDTKNCYCNIEHVEIGNEIFGIPWWCDDLNAQYIVSDANRYATTGVSVDIVYTMERMYCARCHAGYLPRIEPSAQIDGVYLRPDNNGTWGVGMCSNQVTIPYYADGCVIDFSKPTGQAAIEAPGCRKSCPGGFVTDVNGAIDVSQCVSAGAVYEDATGTFVLGSDVCQ